MKHKVLKLSALLVVLHLCSLELVAQQPDHKDITNEEYQVINDVFSNENGKTVIYHIIDFSKTWAYLMSPEQLDNLLGPPCTCDMKVIKWNDLFSKKDFEMIRKEIINCKPIVLNKSKLNKNINLTDSFEIQDQSYSAVSTITKPIIINQYAIVKRSGLYGEVIVVALKDKGRWSVICNKWLFQITND